MISILLFLHHPDISVVNQPSAQRLRAKRRRRNKGLIMEVNLLVQVRIMIVNTMKITTTKTKTTKMKLIDRSN